MNGTEGSLRFGNFEVLAKPDGGPQMLGGGSFGKTYKARHVFLGQVVALKVINERFLHDTNAKARFLREAQVVHQLQHPHIAHVVDFGEAQGSLYYAMEFCGGGSLDEYVRHSGPVSPDLTLVFAQQLAAALICAHQRGFIHRDIKPANVMLTGEGDPPQLKLIDFGLVKRLQGEGEMLPSLTMAGQTFFTPLFASPEQLQEEELDARSDLFSLGMTLWYLVKGGPPETGATATIVARRLNIDSYDKHLPDSLPSGLRSILARLLTKAKEDRFQSASELLAALKAVPSGNPDETRAAIWVPPGQSAVDETAILTQAELPPAKPRSLASEYEFPIEKIRKIAGGTAYRAVLKQDRTVRAVILLDDTTREDERRMDALRRAVDNLGRQGMVNAAGRLTLEQFEEGMALVGEWAGESPAGLDLHSVLKTRGWIPFPEALLALRAIAEAIDFMLVAQLAGMDMEIAGMLLQPAGGGPPFESGRLLSVPLNQWPPFRMQLPPVSLDDEGTPNVTRTMGSITSGDPRVEFSCLVYHIVAGRRVPTAARANRNWVATANFGENSNAILRACIADQFPGHDCASILDALCQSEGVLGSGPSPPPIISFRANVPHAPAPPPDVPRRPFQSPVEPVHSGGSTGMARVGTPPPLPSGVPLSGGWSSGGAPPPPTAVQPSPATGGVASTGWTPPAGVGPGKQQSTLIYLVALVLAAALVGGGAAWYLLKPKDNNNGGGSGATPTPSEIASVPTPVPATPTSMPQVAIATPTPVAQRFTVTGGIVPARAVIESSGGAITTRLEGQNMVISSNPGVKLPANLVIKAPGYQSRSVAATAGETLPGPLILEREKGTVTVAAPGPVDYAFVVFTMTKALDAEKDFVSLDADDKVLPADGSKGRTIDLPTGIYRVMLEGPRMTRDTRIQPFVLVAEFRVQGGTQPLPDLPPSYAGQYQDKFIYCLDAGNIAPIATRDEMVARAQVNRYYVQRTLTIGPGLESGNVQDSTEHRGPGPDGQESVLSRTIQNPKIENLVLDQDGILHGVIRVSGWRVEPSFDELFELRRANGGYEIRGGGWEVPAPPELRAIIDKSTPGRQPQLQQPGWAPVTRVK